MFFLFSFGIFLTGGFGEREKTKGWWCMVVCQVLSLSVLNKTPLSWFSCKAQWSWGPGSSTTLPHHASCKWGLSYSMTCYILYWVPPFSHMYANLLPWYQKSIHQGFWLLKYISLDNGQFRQLYNDIGPSMEFDKPQTNLFMKDLFKVLWIHSTK